MIDIEPGQTLITSNGGGCILPIEALLWRLSNEPLDPTFEKYGDFVDDEAESIDGGPLYPAGTISFFGNFRGYSHCFSLATRDATLAELLTAAIRANKATPAYVAAKIQVAEWARQDAERKRVAHEKWLRERQIRYGRDEPNDAPLSATATARTDLFSALAAE